MIITAGSTNVSVYFYIVQDASGASPGEPVTGLLFSDIETGGSASYVRQGAARTDLELITLASASAVHSEGGFILVDDTNTPGLYRCDYPDAAFVTGVDHVMFQLVVASGKNAVASPVFTDITDVDLRDAVRGGMTALPSAAADAAGGLPISDAGGLDMDDIPITAEFEARTLPTADYVNTNGGTITTLDELDTEQDLEHAITQDLIGNISSGSAALGQNATGFTATSVTETLTFAVTHEEDLIYHELAPVTGVLDAEYTTTLPDSASISRVLWQGFIQGTGDTVLFQFWDWIASDWKTEKTQPGANNPAPMTLQIPAIGSAYTGTGANLGQIRLRIFSSGAAVVTNFATDRLIFEYAVVLNALGFVGGAVWLDSIGGEPGVTAGIGTVSRPSNNITDARTIADSNNLRVIHSLSGSSFALDQTYNDFEFTGFGYSIALNGKDIGGCVFRGGVISGIGIGSSLVVFQDALFPTTISVNMAAFRFCNISGIITFTEAEKYSFDGCISGVAGLATPTLNFGTEAGVKEVIFRHHSGGITLEAMGDLGADVMSFEGWGQVIEGTCTGGTVVVRGHATTAGITNITISEDARIDVAQIKAQAVSAISDAQLATAANLATVDAKIDAVQGATFNTSTDSLEAIRNQGDTAWVTGPTVEQVRTEMDDNSTKLADIVGDTNELQTDWANGGRLDVIIDATLADTANMQPKLGTPAADISADIAAVPAGVLAAGDIDGLSLEEAQKIQTAALGGKLSGAGTSTETIRAFDDSKARITATVDAAGNRTAITTDVTG